MYLPRSIPPLAVVHIIKFALCSVIFHKLWGTNKLYRDSISHHWTPRELQYLRYMFMPFSYIWTIGSQSTSVTVQYKTGRSWKTMVCQKLVRKFMPLAVNIRRLFIWTLERHYVKPVHTSNNVERILSNATSRTILSTKSNVASTLLLVWTGLNAMCLSSMPISRRTNTPEHASTQYTSRGRPVG